MLSEEEKLQIIKLLQNDLPLPEKYRTRLFNCRELIKTAEEIPMAFPLEICDPMRKFTESDLKDQWSNKLYWGDNLSILHYLLSDDLSLENSVAGKIKLIYIDPPFNAGKHFHLYASRDFPFLSPFAFSDLWEAGLEEYLGWLIPRLKLMWELLAPDGVIFVHCDWRSSARIKLLLDDIFKFYVNEIIWHYTGGGRSKSFFSRKHDSIFIYTKSASFNFYPDQIRIPYSTKSAYAKNGIVSRAGKKYMPNSKGAVPDDVWDLPIINPLAKERCRYPTQKPEALLERIILSCTIPGDLVADFFCGSGVTGIVSQKLGRRWLLADLGSAAIQTTKQRLQNLADKHENTYAAKAFSIWVCKNPNMQISNSISECLNKTAPKPYFLYSPEGHFLIFPYGSIASWHKIHAFLKNQDLNNKDLYILSYTWNASTLFEFRETPNPTSTSYHFLNLPPFFNPALTWREQCGPAIFPEFKLSHEAQHIVLEICALNWGADIFKSPGIKRNYKKNSAFTENALDWQKALDYWEIDPSFIKKITPRFPFPIFKSAWHSGKKSPNATCCLRSPILPFNSEDLCAIKIRDVFFNETLLLLNPSKYRCIKTLIKSM